MKNEFVPYAEALALKELGFDYCCFCSYSPEGELADSYGTYYKIHPSEVTIAPLYQQAFRWFREKGIYGEPTSDLSNNLEDRVFVYSSYSESGGYFVDRSEEYDTYEEAQLACLRKLIERLKQNKHE